MSHVVIMRMNCEQLFGDGCPRMSGCTRVVTTHQELRHSMPSYQIVSDGMQLHTPLDARFSKPSQLHSSKHHCPTRGLEACGPKIALGYR